MNNCDFETALKQKLNERTFFPEYSIAKNGFV